MCPFVFHEGHVSRVPVFCVVEFSVFTHILTPLLQRICFSPRRLFLLLITCVGGAGGLTIREEGSVLDDASEFVMAEAVTVMPKVVRTPLKAAAVFANAGTIACILTVFCDVSGWRFYFEVRQQAYC